MAEQLRLQQVLLNRGAVDVGERSISARREAVDGPRHQLLARPALAGDQHRVLRASDLAGEVEHLLHGPTGRDDLRELLTTREPRLQSYVFLGELALLERAPDQHFQLGHPARLGDVVVGAQLHRRDGRLHGAVAGDDDDLGWRVELHGLAEHADPVHLRHDEVHQRHVEILRLQGIDGSATVVSHHHVEAPLAELRLEDAREVPLVLSQQDLDIYFSHASSPLFGRVGCAVVLRLLAAVDRKHHAKVAADSNRRIHLDSATVFLNDPVAYRKPETRPLAG